MDILVRDLMTTTVNSITPEREFSEAIRTMAEYRHSCLVVAEKGVPIGIVTERDVVRLAAESSLNTPQKATIIRDVMSVPVATISENATLFEALVITSAQKIRHLPVVDGNGRLMGLVTQSDLTKAHFHIFEKQREIIENCITTRTRELEIANEQLKALTMVDALMAIGNRRAMEVDLDHTHALALRYQRTYSLVLFDVDYFKLYNDTCGHLAGDDVLRNLAAFLQRSIRKSDRVYRYGGEEILMLLPETTLHGALILAERFVNQAADLDIPHPGSPLGVVTLSCGVASESSSATHPSWHDLVSIADEGLYASKHNGRNRATAKMLTL